MALRGTSEKAWMRAWSRGPHPEQATRPNSTPDPAQASTRGRRIDLAVAAVMAHSGAVGTRQPAEAEHLSARATATLAGSCRPSRSDWPSP